MGAGDEESLWRAANAVMAAVIAMLVVTWTVKAMRGPASDPAEGDHPPEAIAIAPLPGPTSQAWSGRDFMRPVVRPARRPPAPVLAAPPAPVVPLRERIAHWRLVGVAGGNPPQAIIEDERAQRTHYLSPGESLDGVRVEEVSHERVRLSCQDEGLELAP